MAGSRDIASPRLLRAMDCLKYPIKPLQLGQSNWSIPSLNKRNPVTSPSPGFILQTLVQHIDSGSQLEMLSARNNN